MDTRRLRHFLAVFEEGSICRASEKVFLTQPALSKSIRQLERDLGVPLFDRTPLGVIPTVYARSLAHYAQTIQAELRSAQLQIDSLKGNIRGRVRIGAGPSVATSVLPSLVTSLRDTHPGIEVTVLGGLVDNLLPQLRRCDLDLIIGAWPRLQEPDLHTEVVADETVRILAGCKHPFAAADAAHTLADLVDQDWALPPETQRWRQCLDEIFVAQGLNPPRATVVSTSSSFLRSLVDQGGHLTFLPTRLFEKEMTRGEVVPLLPEVRLDCQITVTHRATKYLGPSTNAVIDLLTCHRHGDSDERPGWENMPGLLEEVR